LPDDHKNAINILPIISCINDKNKYQFDAVNKDSFDRRLQELDIDPEKMSNAWSMFAGTFWSEQELLERLSGSIATINKLFSIWATTPLRNLKLTSVGIAIAHANLVRVAEWKSDLSIWIK
ncbi:MAG: LPO_1073/Vpar_1526 family protein, partial [Brevundimonas sp.]